MSHFYATLPSNSSMQVFPENKPQHYNVNVNFSELDGNWEVGLSELHCPTTWYNVTKP